MKRTFLTLGLIWIVLETGAQREEFMESGLAMTTRVYQNLIGSATCFISGVPVSDPAIQLNSGDQLELHFDALGSSYHDYTFFAVHCDANWNPTDLEANEYIQGFNTLNISDFDDSFNTRVPYVHYRAYFPCDLMKPRYSGNYLLVVTPEDEGGNPVLTQRVVVYEQICPLTLEAKLSSTVSHRYSHQEVDARLGTRDYQIFNASEDLHVTILQNFEWSTAKTNIQPQFIKSDEITFDLY
ncbi:MAG: DUF5103 domain-containing protein, partial [Flavobacteriales bacterium]|nr:DUF5103 domain-containing protein [Flavobacteriales bacterium]